MSVILAIESSCDDTSAAVIVNGDLKSNIIAGQDIHAAYGGVVPELASRAHQQQIVPVVTMALKRANISKKEITAIAFTKGPGLLGSLLVGVSFAKSMAMALDVPIIDVNHMEAHILAHFIDNPKPKFPFICLTVSGGHTQIVLVKSPLEFELLGETLDDAVGEAFDKSAKMLGLPYPGGPMVDKLAQHGNNLAYKFPEPAIQGLNFSFSGIKTAILYFLRDETKLNPNFVTENLNDICASIQYSLVNILIKKLKKASKTLGVKQIAVAGGVAANSELRKQLKELAEKERLELFIPDFQYCTDNAGMIAMAAHFKYEAGLFAGQDIVPAPGLGLS